MDDVYKKYTEKLRNELFKMYNDKIILEVEYENLLNKYNELMNNIETKKFSEPNLELNTSNKDIIISD